MANYQKPRSNYESGTDYTMEFGPFRFRFSGSDFRERVEAAAARLRFVRRAELDQDELEDLVELAAHGRITRPTSGLAAHVAEHADRLAGFDDDLVYWLRKLVFRGAWVDQQVKEGRLCPVFGENGFSYRSAITSEPLVDEATTPDWSEASYPGTSG
jgi:hypothetical protein